MGRINPELRRLIEQKRWDDMKTLVSDEMLDTFCVSGTYREIANAARQRIEGLTDTLSSPLPFDAQDRRDQLAEAIRDLKQLQGADAYREQFRHPASAVPVLST